MRLDHWIKNFFMLPGAALAFSIYFKGSIDNFFDEKLYISLFFSFIALCFASSANYVINEWLDRSKDAIHPYKNHRIATKADFKPIQVYGLYIFLILIVLLIFQVLNPQVRFFISLLIFMGILYNVQPLRLKDRYYLDVLSESVNNPIRFAIGWCSLVPSKSVPASAFLAFWGIGIFLMALKRYSEMKLIDNPALMASYRKSFEKWNPQKLLIFSMVGALIGSTFLGILLAKRRVEYIFLFPVLISLFVEYLKMSLELDPASYAPEKLMKKKNLVFLVLILGILFIVFTLVDIKGLHEFIYTDGDQY